jgi:hypothetical protein
VDGVGAKLHHRDVVGLALRRLEKEFCSGVRDEVLKDLDDELHKG